MSKRKIILNKYLAVIQKDVFCIKLHHMATKEKIHRITSSLKFSIKMQIAKIALEEKRSFSQMVEILLQEAVKNRNAKN